MKIGIIGTGNMGRALGLRWSDAGHRVLFGSRDPTKARTVAAEAAGSAEAGDFDAAAAFGDVVLYTVREPLPSQLLRQPQSLSGKVLVDCNNSAIFGFDLADAQGRPGLHFPASVPSLAERLAADVPEAHVVKAFNTMPAQLIGRDREALAPHRVSVFLCSDDAGAKATVGKLAEDIGFVAVDSGGLERAQLVEAVADFIRFHILELGRGPLTAISLHQLPET